MRTPLPFVLAEARKAAGIETSKAGDHLRLGADAWDRYIKAGDNYLDAGSKVIAAAKAVFDAQQKGDVDTARKENVDLSRAVSTFLSAANKGYGNFKNGREYLYLAAKEWGIPTRRAGVGGKAPKPLAGVDAKDLYAEIASIGSAFVSAVHSMLDTGVPVVKEMRQAAKKQNLLTDEEKKSLVDRALDFRDAQGSAVYRLANSLGRRSTELSNRTWQEEAKKTEKWKTSWADDPEIGDTE